MAEIGIDPAVAAEAQNLSRADLLRQQKLEKKQVKQERIENRAGKAAERGRKAVELFNQGLSRMKAAAESGVQKVVTAPEAIANQVDRASDWVGDRVIDARAWAAEKDDQIANAAESGMKKVVGRVESWGLRAQSEVAKGRAALALAQSERALKHGEKISQKAQTEVDRLNKQIMELKMKRDEVKEKAYDQMIALHEKASEREETAGESMAAAKDLREQAGERRNNGRALGGLRAKLGGFIRG